MAEESKTIHAVEAASKRRRDALLGADATQLLKLTRRDVNYIHSNGVFDTGAAAISKIGSDVIYKAISEADLRTVVIGEDCVVRSGNMEVDAEITGKAKRLAIAFTEVWARGDDGWQLASWQSTPRI